MIHVQVISRSGEKLQSLIRAAIAAGKIKSLEVAGVKGGLRLRHKMFKGELKFSQTRGPLLVSLATKNRAKEFQLLETLVGRLVYHFKNEISSINIQLEHDE